MSRRLSVGLSAAAALCLLLWGFHYSSFDLWGDELVSLKDYALVGLGTTITTYLDPNNHILFNLLNNLLSDLFGARDLYQAMHRAPLFRWAQWLIAVGTCLYVLWMGRKFFSPTAGVLSLVFLVTCLPFLNFSMQLRGYGLTMFFAAALAYHTWSAEERRSWKQLTLTCVSTFGLLYVIPSNVYFAFALGLMAAWRTIWPTDESEKGIRLLQRRGVLVVAALISGSLLALLAYSPVLSDVLHNRFVEASPDDRMFILSQRLPQVAGGLVSLRYLLIPIALGGFFFAVRRDEGRTPGSERASYLIALLVLPFVFSFLRDDDAFQRTFLFLAPISSVALGAGVAWCLERGVGRIQTRSVLTLLVAAYAFGTLGFTYVTVQAKLGEGLESGVKEQSLLANYYQFQGFRPSQVARELARVHREAPGPIVLVDELDPVSLAYYLLDQNLNSTSILYVTPARPGTGTHTTLFQKSQGRGGDLTSYQTSISLSDDLEDGNLLTPALVVVEAYEPSDRYYVVTAFYEKNVALFRAHYPSLGLETVFEFEGLACLRITTN